MGNIVYDGLTVRRNCYKDLKGVVLGKDWVNKAKKLHQISGEAISQILINCLKDVGMKASYFFLNLK